MNNDETGWPVQPKAGVGVASSPTGVPLPSLSTRSAELLAPGTVLGGRYEILALLGQGGMGAVYKAQDRSLERTVAIKMILPELANDPAALQRFKQELILAREITHKNVVRIFDLAEVDGLTFITMEFVEGESLTGALNARGKLPVDEAVEIMRQVCAGLQAAHEKGVIHRDLKPANIMRDAQGRIVLMDFGLARTAESTGMTQTGMLVGTMEYMSPEQANSREVDARSDLFAVGLIFYELLTGQRPYQADSTIASLVKRTRERAPTPSSVNAVVPGVLSDVVMRCLEIDPAKRYQSAAELHAALEGWQGAGRAAAHAARRALQYIVVAVVAAVLLITSTVVVRKLRSRAHPAAAHSPTTVLLADFENKTGDPVFQDTLESALSIALEAAPFINSYRRGGAHRIASQLRPGSSTMNEEIARLVAVREGINVVVSGAIAQDGAGYRVSARAVDAVTGNQLAAPEITVGSRDQVLTAISRLAAPIRATLGDTTPESAQLAAAETFTAGSLDAAHAYSVAQDLFEAGNSEQAIELYKKAIAADPNLGRAYAGLAVASVNLKKKEDAAAYYKKALGLLDHMSERERYRTLGTYYAAFMHNYPEAIQNYERLVFLFPGDTAAYNNLSITYFFTLDLPKAIAAIRKGIELSPNNLKFHLNYAVYSMYGGDFSTAVSETQRILEQNPSYQFAYLPLGMSLTARGNVEQAREVYAKLEKVNPGLARIGEGDLEMYLGRYKPAMSALDAGIAINEKDKDNGEAAYKYVAKAEAQLALGHSQAAAEAAQKSFKLSPDEEAVLYPAARVLIQAGEDGKARKLASDLSATLQTQNQALAQLIYGEIALQHKQLPQAVEAFQQAQRLHGSWMSHFLMGRAYLEAGHFGEALAEFDTCKRRQGETADLMFADTATLRYLPPLFYWMGRAQQGVGMQTAATESFEKYRTLRANSDIADPMLAAANVALAGK